MLEFEQSIRVRWPDLVLAKAWACRPRHGRDFVFAIVFVFCPIVLVNVTRADC